MQPSILQERADLATKELQTELWAVPAVLADRLAHSPMMGAPNSGVCGLRQFAGLPVLRSGRVDRRLLAGPFADRRLWCLVL